MTLRRALLTAILAVLVACARPHIVFPPDRYYLPYVPDGAILCVEQASGQCSYITAGDLRKLLASMGKA